MKKNILPITSMMPHENETMEELMQECTASRLHYLLLYFFNIYEVTCDLESYKGKDLYLGGIELGTDLYTFKFKRDAFSNVMGRFGFNNFNPFQDRTPFVYGDGQIVVKDVLDKGNKTFTIVRTNGEITIKGIYDPDHIFNYVDIEFDSIYDYVDDRLVDVKRSKKINGDWYYVLDLQRVKKHDEKLLKFMCDEFHTDFARKITKTLYFHVVDRKTKAVEIGLWDLAKEYPVNKEAVEARFRKAIEREHQLAIEAGLLD